MPLSVLTNILLSSTELNATVKYLINVFSKILGSTKIEELFLETKLLHFVILTINKMFKLLKIGIMKQIKILLINSGFQISHKSGKL
jgi:hypothetical protein